MDQKADILKENERLLISLQQLEGIVLAFRSGNVNALVNQPTDSDLSRLRVLEIRYSSSTVRTVDFGSLGPVRSSARELRLRHLATVFGLMP
jgi:hypothetical protein